MKYEIPQERLDKIVFKYLDNELNDLEKARALYHNGFVFSRPERLYGLMGLRSDGTLIIFRGLITGTASFFGLTHEDSKQIIGRWVADRFQVEVKDTVEYKEGSTGLVRKKE